MRRSSWLLAAALFVAAPPLSTLFARAARAEETPPPAAEKAAPVQKGDQIAWIRELPRAFERAKATNKIVMICINSNKVDGGRVEPAAKGLREVVYKDLRVVQKSREFICAYLTQEGSSEDFGELRARFAIEGLIVSPQHLFVAPNGQDLLGRHEYWPYGKGDGAVEALIDMMKKAQAKLGVTSGTPETPDADPSLEPAPEAPPPAAPSDQSDREAWIAATLLKIKQGSAAGREAAIQALVTNDKDGDCVDPLIAILSTLGRDEQPILVSLIRGLGHPGLEKAADPIATYLKHRDDEVRGNAAVSLEYIGSKESIDALRKQVSREKNEAIANHMYRALGRCAAGDAAARKLLAKKVQGSKSYFASYGPIIGLAYFEGDKNAARAVEKILKKVGPPSFGRRGGWDTGKTLQRAYLTWALAEIGDPKSAAFIREEMIKPLEHVQSRWLGAIISFFTAAAQKCDGDSEAMDAIEQGVRETLRRSNEGSLQDEMREGRDSSSFEPKAEWSGGEAGGGPGGPGGPRGPGGPGGG